MFARSGTGNYAYTSARVKAKKSRLLRPEDYSKMLMQSVPEMSHYISEAGYSKEMTDLASRYDGLDLVEYATYANMGKAFRSILASSTGDLKSMISAYLTRWDFTNLKTILRGKNCGLPADEIREDLLVAGKLDAEDLEKLISASTVEETITAFTAMTYIAIPEDAIAKYREGLLLAPIEDSFVKIFYKRLLDAIGRGGGRPNEIFRHYVRFTIDVKNVKTVLKLKAEDVYGSVVMDYFIPGGIEIDQKVMSQLAEAPDLKSALSSMQQLKMYADIKDSITEDSDIMDVGKALNAYKARMSKSFAQLYPLSVIPVLDYMIHKENEVRNVRLIARGTESGLDRETINSLLVI